MYDVDLVFRSAMLVVDLDICLMYIYIELCSYLGGVVELPGLGNVFSVLQQGFSTNDLLWFVSAISRFHRIQSSRGLEEAADFIAKNFLDLGNAEVRVYRYSYGERYGIHLDVVGWDVRDGFVELVSGGRRRVLSSFTKSKTAVAAHSPAGDVEAEVVYVGDGLDLERYRG